MEASERWLEPPVSLRKRLRVHERVVHRQRTEARSGPVAPGAGATGCWYLGALPREQVDPRLLPAAQRRGCTQSGSPPPWAAPPPTCSAPARADGRSAGLPNFSGRWPAKLSASACSAVMRRLRCHFHLSVCATRPRSPPNRSGAAASARHLRDNLLSPPAHFKKCFSPGSEHFTGGCEGVWTTAGMPPARTHAGRTHRRGGTQASLVVKLRPEGAEEETRRRRLPDSCPQRAGSTTTV